MLAACASRLTTNTLGPVDVAITRVAVVDVERGRVVRDQDVLLHGDRIVYVGPTARRSLPSSARVVPGAGAYLMPGLWDMHAHLNIAGDPVRQELPLFIAHGVTGIRVMSSPTPRVGLDRFRALQASVARREAMGPHLLAIASWPVNGAAGIPATMPTFFGARTEAEGQQLARYFKENGYDFIKVYNNISRAGYMGLAAEARRLGLPFAGHEPGALSALELSAAGQGSIEHSRIFLFNCFPGADSLRRGVLTGTPTTQRQRMVDEYSATQCAEVFRTFAQNRTYITPTHVTRRMDAMADDSAYRQDARLRYIPPRQRMEWLADANGMVASDSSRAGRKSFMDFYLKGLTLTRDAYRAGVPVMLGTDAGDSFVFPGASVHDELLELVKAGLSPAEALRAATMAGAAYMGKATEFGQVRAGYAADLVLLESNPLEDIRNSQRIRTVVRGGRVLARAALDSMLASVEVAIRPDRQNALWIASITGDTAGIVQALDAGARIDSLDAQGNRRPLNYAAANNRVAAVRVLLARGANINLTNATGFTPVHHAIEAGAVGTLQLLLDARADLSIPNARGVLPIETARRLANPAVLRLLQR